MGLILGIFSVTLLCFATLTLGLLCLRFAARVRQVESRFGPIVSIEDERARLTKERDELSSEIEKRRRQCVDELERERRSHEASLSAEAAKVQAERESLLSAIRVKREWFEEQTRQSETELERLRQEVRSLEEQGELQSFGLYKPHYDLGVPEAYRKKLDEVRDRQASMLKAKNAAVCSERWQVDGSAAKGKQMTDRYLKLQLRAFNGECDAAVARVRYNNAVALEERIRKSFEAINRLGETQKCKIVEPYLELRIAELRLEHEYAVKLQEEKEEQRRIREQLREEEIAQREFEQAQKEAEREERRAAAALEKAHAQLGAAFDAENAEARARIEELEIELQEALRKKEAAISRAQLTKSGHVYVISNEGSFGHNVFKVGMTRRLDPMDRIKELGDASVPFSFDLHALIFTHDAPALEARLHQALDDKRVNLANLRKEFFAATLEDIDSAICGCDVNTELVRQAEAAEYRQTVAIRTARLAKLKADAEAAVFAVAETSADSMRKRWTNEPA